LGRYYGDPTNELWIIYTDPVATAQIKEYPHVKAHLDKFARVITSDNRPYGLHRARDERFFLGEKIVSLRKTTRPHFTFTDFPCYVSQTFFVLKPADINLKYLVGILNSRLCYFWLDRRGKKQGDALQVDKAPLLETPIRSVNLSDPADKALQDKMVSLVEQMIELSQQERAAKSESTRTRIGQAINVTQEQIDSLVYELYRLTDEEIKIVEGTA
jgi:adenine-specific DNA-methyltransferase